MELRQVVETLVKRIVRLPDDVEVKETSADSCLIFEVRVAKQDMGRIIGKKGKTIEALRTIVGAFGVKKDKRCNIQLIEDEE